jgi:hypothetical protein
MKITIVDKQSFICFDSKSCAMIHSYFYAHTHTPTVSCCLRVCVRCFLILKNLVNTHKHCESHRYVLLIVVHMFSHSLHTDRFVSNRCLLLYFIFMISYFCANYYNFFNPNKLLLSARCMFAVKITTKFVCA